MGGSVNQLANIIALVIGAAIVAILAAKPAIVQNFFAGIGNVVGAATSPVLKTAPTSYPYAS